LRRRARAAAQVLDATLAQRARDASSGGAGSQPLPARLVRSARSLVLALCTIAAS
jgi:hypothetical protein